LGRIFLAHAIAAAWGGVPVVWSGDELGQTNDPNWMDEEDNVTERPRPFPVHLIQAFGFIRPYEALSGYDLHVGADGMLWLPPYGAWWVVERPGSRP
jgi:hypothetical protein